MKTPFIKNLKMLAITGWTCWLAVTCTVSTSAQDECKAEQYLQALPAGLQLVEKNPQKYRMTSVYYNRDIYGNFIDKLETSGEYTRGLDNGFVKWNNVRISTSKEEEGVFPEGQKQEYMENFSYRPHEDMLKESAFTGFPEINPYDFNVKNLVWDMMGFEAFAWIFYDSLKLNRFIAAEELNAKMELSGSGTFENKHIRVMLAGITTMHGEICAVIQYLAMDNPLEFNIEMSGTPLTIKGRSHYWGNVLLSLEDKQIEQAILFEDVVVKVNIPGVQTDFNNTTREIILNKLN
jgi:hypothetical protein